MAKRLLDTNRYSDSWFRKLPIKGKAIWDFMLSNCNHAGIFTFDPEIINFYLGEDLKLTHEIFMSYFSTKIIQLSENKYFIPYFIEVQYGILDPRNRVHLSVLSILKKEGANIDLVSPYLGCKDKDKDISSFFLKENTNISSSKNNNTKDYISETEDKKEQKKDKKIKPGKKETKSLFNLQELYDAYPRKEGKNKGLANLKKQIKTQEDFSDCLKAILNYKSANIDTEKKYIKMFSTFTTDEFWRDYVALLPDDFEREKSIKEFLKEEEQISV